MGVCYKAGSHVKAYRVYLLQGQSKGPHNLTSTASFVLNPALQSYNSQPIPYVIVRLMSSLSIKPYTWCSYTRCMFTLMTLLVRNRYLAENRVLSKK